MGTPSMESIQYEEERNSDQAQDPFYCKEESPDCFCPWANLCTPGYEGVFCCSLFTSLKGLILLTILSASVLSSSVLHCRIPLVLDDEYQP